MTPHAASLPASNPQCDEACANHTQADHDDGKEAGRSKIFAHEEPCRAMRQTRMALHVANDTPFKPLLRFRLSSWDEENDFVGMTEGCACGATRNSLTELRGHSHREFHSNAT